MLPPFSVHHYCGIIQNPLDCLRSTSNAMTEVAMLDSMLQMSADPMRKLFWGHFLLSVWDALEDHRNELGLDSERPALEQVMAKISIHRPPVCVYFQGLDNITGADIRSRYGFRITAMIVASTSFETSSSPSTPGKRRNNSWLV